MFIAMGFLWRVGAGAVAVKSKRVRGFMCTGFLSLFLGFNKREEVILVKDQEGTTRKLRTIQ